MVKLCFIDVETTGLDPKLNGVVQIAGQIVFGQGAEYTVIETFNFKVQPFPFDQINQKALEINGLTEAVIFSYQEPKDVLPQFLAILNRHVDRKNYNDNFFFVGYNASFDDGFMREFFIKNSNHDYSRYFYRPALDVMQLALFRLKDERASMLNFKLTTVAALLNFKPEGNFHDAMTDIIATRQIFEFCIYGLDRINEAK